MVKRTITYTDYNGEIREEDFYFNLTKPELVELELGEDGGLKSYLEKIVKSRDARNVLSMFKKIIGVAYGIKSPDGRRFIKSKEVSEAFFQSEAYVVLYTDLLEHPDMAANFISSMLPDDMRPSSAQLETVKQDIGYDSLRNPAL